MPFIVTGATLIEGTVIGGQGKQREGEGGREGGREQAVYRREGGEGGS